MPTPSTCSKPSPKRVSLNASACTSAPSTSSRSISDNHDCMRHSASRPLRMLRIIATTHWASETRAWGCLGRCSSMTCTIPSSSMIARMIRQVGRR